jgi:hypothetical protein
LKIYQHEIIDIVGQGRADYFQHITAGWGPIAREERGQICLGVWGTVGTTGRWPEVVNIWEFDGWEGLQRNFQRELVGAGMQDPSLREWWAKAANYRSGGFDRIMLPADFCPNLDDLLRDQDIVGSEVFIHEIIATHEGRAGTLLEQVKDHYLPLMLALRVRLVGAYRTAMRDDSEVILVWAVRKWDDWAKVETALHGSAESARWLSLSRPLATGRTRTLMSSAPLSPLRTGSRL